LGTYANWEYQDVGSGIEHVVEDLFSKDMSIFHHGTTEKFTYRKCILDSGSRGSPGNLISKRALREIRCEIKKDAGRKVRGLGFNMRLKNFVILKFRFWGQPEIYEAEFRVAPTLTLFGVEFGAPFDCLLGKDWMEAHQHAWIPQSLLKSTTDSGEGGPGTA
jgi:hypothetical protein